MLYVGIVISGVGIVLYVISAVLINYYYRKNRPDILKQSNSKLTRGQGRKIIVTRNVTSPGAGLLGFISMPVFLIGIGVIILSLIIKALGRIF